jgi:hypothetical protein
MIGTSTRLTISSSVRDIERLPRESPLFFKAGRRSKRITCDSGYRELEEWFNVSQGVVSVADADKAVCWGPGLRWGIHGACLAVRFGGWRGDIEGAATVAF